MRILFIILFLSTIVANELVIDLMLFKEHEISLHDTPIDNQSETESQDSTEEESKIDYFNDYSNIGNLDNSKYSLSPNCIASHLLTPYMEIQSPPPE